MKHQVAKIKVYSGFDLEKIVPLVKEWYRLSRIIIDVELAPEIEERIQGEG